MVKTTPPEHLHAIASKRRIKFEGQAWCGECGAPFSGVAIVHVGECSGEDESIKFPADQPAPNWWERLTARFMDPNKRKQP